MAAVGLATAIFTVAALHGSVGSATTRITHITSHWVAEMVEHELTQAEKAVQQTARDPRTIACLENPAGLDCAGFLKLVLDEQRQSSRLRSLGLADATGVLRYRSPDKEGLLGRCFAYREWFHGPNPACTATKDASCSDPAIRASCPPLSELHLSAPFHARSDNQEVFTISMPVKRPGDGRTLGVLQASRTVMDLQEQIRTAEVPLKIVIVNDRSQVIVHPKRPQVDKLWQLPASLLERRDGIEPALDDPISGERYAASFSQVGSRGWVVIVGRGNALRDVVRIAYWSAYVLVGLALLGALASLWLLGSARRRRAA